MRIFNVDITEFRVVTAMDGVADLLRTKGPELGRACRLKTNTGRRWVSVVRGHHRRWLLAYTDSGAEHTRTPCGFCAT